MAKKSENAESEMSFFDHLHDLRSRIMCTLGGLIVASIFSAFFVDYVRDELLIGPIKQYNIELQNLQPSGQVFLTFKIVIFVGLILSIPNTLYQVWLFVAPGLYEHERSWARKITFFSTFCFLAGVFFAYYIMIPTMLEFIAKFGSPHIKNSFDITEYFSFFNTTLLSAGLIFELPMISFVLAKAGILTSQFMRKYRRHAAVIILIVAAALTPSTDPFSQLVFAAPLWVLFEISILVAASVEKRAKKSAV